MESTPVMKLNSVGYLRLAYVATEITLHRRIVLALSPSTDPQLQQICRSVARERFMFAIDFIQSLKPQHLSSFWYFASPQNFALIAVFGTLLLSTASTTEEADFYKTRLRECRWTLKINSENGARYMKPAMALLDANMGLLSEAKSLTAPQPMSANPAEYPNVANENPSSTGSYTEESPLSSTQLPSSVDFASPGQFSFDTPYFPGQHSEETSPANTEVQPQGFGFGPGSNSGLWY
jgi:hypothetical protein